MALHKTGTAGSGGSSFEYEKHSQNKKVEKIKVWIVKNKRIKALSIWLTGEAEKTYGDTSKPAGEGNNLVAELQMQKGERIAEMQCWANSDGNRIGWIYIKTSNGRIWNTGGQKGSQNIFTVNTGIWVGCYGGYGSDINRFGAIFINQTSLKLVNVTYPNLQSTTGSVISKVTLMSFSLHNNMNSEALEFQAYDTDTRKLTSKWSISYPSTGLFEFDFFKPSSMQGEAIIPVLVANTNDTVGWTLSSSPFKSTNIFSENTQTMPNFYEYKDVESGAKANIAANIWEGKLSSIPYNGSIQIGTSSSSRIAISGYYSCNYYKIV